MKLVRFENRTYQCDDDIFSSLHDLTGWPVDRFVLVSSNHPFYTVRVRSSLRGGKGGFGTLLKGQARQSGANQTTNFGSCRDLQGRRLQHINDQLLFQHYREWQAKLQAGEATEADMLQSMIKTDTGIANWHLGVPAYAAGTFKAHSRKLARQFYSWKRQTQAAKEEKERQRQERERSVQNYLDAATMASEAAAKSVQSAIAEGLVAAKKPKVVEEDDDVVPPMALLTLSGEVSVSYHSGWKIESGSNFATIALMMPSKDFYYEVLLESGGLCQMGVACEGFQPNDEEGDGVGDCKHSYACDGSRQIKLHDEKTSGYGEEWEAGDVIGCLVQNGEVTFSRNGIDLGVCFTTNNVCFPAISLNAGEIITFRIDESEMEYRPENVLAIGAMIGKEGAADGDDKIEEKAPARDENGRDSGNKSAEPASSKPKAQPVEVKALNLDEYTSVEQLEELGLDRLKGALMAIGIKCGGTLQERAARLFSLKGIQPEDYPPKLLAKRKR